MSTLEGEALAAMEDEMVNEMQNDLHSNGHDSSANIEVDDPEADVMAEGNKFLSGLTAAQSDTPVSMSPDELANKLSQIAEDTKGSIIKVREQFDAVKADFEEYERFCNETITNHQSKISMIEAALGVHEKPTKTKRTRKRKPKAQTKTTKVEVPGGVVAVDEGVKEDGSEV